MVQVLSVDNVEQQKSLFNGKAASFPASFRKSFCNEGYLEQYFLPPPKKERGSEGREALKN